MSKHYQIESNITLSGANADERIQINLLNKALSNLYNLKWMLIQIKDERLNIGQTLKANKSKSIVVCNSNNKEVQLLVNVLIIN